MSISYSLDHITTSVEDVSVEVAAKSEMVSQGPRIAKNGDRFHDYVLASGDNAYPAIVSYGSNVQQRTTGPIRRVTMALSTWASATDSVSGLVTKKPILGQVVIELPADMTIEVADADDLIGNMFSYMYLSVTTKVRDTSWLLDLLYGSGEVK
ncbi:TPA_asm: coat protein [ssRNA phage Zoerhiza.1_23]|uniref:Coat protein n=2 Tax=Leviviricetes TaxID=2842243 RepID=A0A8S5KZ05_9VIRU|nr:coat protein [ssRNA phage Zoerhiza.1_23]QDH90794.1 MAG: hypothetical protein H1Rhizo26FD242_000003 [Leviviridae sp.]DAD50090.1 TPA_asm: coat protein [ssRNA phage Zoerhiza.1_23]